ncbi:MAG: ATP-binding protein [Phycisphaerae bacterium]|jgi:signal transduction histidine kinase
MDTLHVLVVDDEAGMRHAVGRALQTFHVHLPDVEGEVRFEVTPAGSGEEALQKIAAAAPDIMLLDHKMSGITGVDVLERLHERETDVLTIMITAFATLETAIRATKSGAFDFLAKPFTPEELRETIRKAAAHLVVQRQARKLAAEKRRVRFEFISVLGHELKAPLAAIEGYLNIIRDRALGTDLSAYDQVVERCLLRGEGMRKLIFDLLDMTRIESGEKGRTLTTVSLHEVAESAIETVRPAAADQEIELHVDCPADLNLRADRGEIEIIFNNLLTNAVKYNRKGGKANIRVTGDEQRITIEVSDTGIGLSPQEAARLFHDFVRISNARTRNIPGSGLGLSLVKKLALMYGGDVDVQSEPEVGSTFTVILQRDYSPPGMNDATGRGPELASRN